MIQTKLQYYIWKITHTKIDIFKINSNFRVNSVSVSQPPKMYVAVHLSGCLGRFNARYQLPKMTLCHAKNATLMLCNRNNDETRSINKYHKSVMNQKSTKHTNWFTGPFYWLTMIKATNHFLMLISKNSLNGSIQQHLRTPTSDEHIVRWAENKTNASIVCVCVWEMCVVAV